MAGLAPARFGLKGRSLELLCIHGRQADRESYAVELRSGVTLAHRFAFDPTFGRGAMARLSFSQSVQVSFLSRHSVRDGGSCPPKRGWVKWPLESELRRHLLCFRQACRLTTLSSEWDLLSDSLTNRFEPIRVEGAFESRAGTELGYGVAIRMFALIFPGNDKQQCSWFLS